MIDSQGHLRLAYFVVATAFLMSQFSASAAALNRRQISSFCEDALTTRSSSRTAILSVELDGVPSEFDFAHFTEAEINLEKLNTTTDRRKYAIAAMRLATEYVQAHRVQEAIWNLLISVRRSLPITSRKISKSF